MNLRDLQYLVAVEREKHFHRAAESCFVSQPTLSGQLRKLEDELGVQLVDRSTRSVNMTEAGQAIANKAREILSEVIAIRDLAAKYQDPMAGELQLGLIPTVAPYLLPHIMQPLRKVYPQMHLWLHEYQTNVLLDMLKKSELDLLILALPVETMEFSEIPLYMEPFQLALPSTASYHPDSSLINLADLEGQEMLLLEEGHCLRGQALEVCYSAGASENAGFQASSLETLRHMVGEGMGMTLIPELAVPSNTRKSDPIVYQAFSDPKPSRTIGMLYRKGSYREFAFENIAKTIIAALPNRVIQADSLSKQESANES
ncbi:MAG: DNA-binding transcriptional regulator OxyR [bacterium]